MAFEALTSSKGFIFPLVSVLHQVQSKYIAFHLCSDSSEDFDAPCTDLKEIYNYFMSAYWQYSITSWGFMRIQTTMEKKTEVWKTPYKTTHATKIPIPIIWVTKLTATDSSKSIWIPGLWDEQIMKMTVKKLSPSLLLLLLWLQP